MLNRIIMDALYLMRKHARKSMEPEATFPTDGFVTQRAKMSEDRARFTLLMNIDQRNTFYVWSQPPERWADGSCKGEITANAVLRNKGLIPFVKTGIYSLKKTVKDKRFLGCVQRLTEVV